MWNTFIYVFLALIACVLIQKCLHVAGLYRGLGLMVLASASFWPRLTSLADKAET